MVKLKGRPVVAILRISPNPLGADVMVKSVHAGDPNVVEAEVARLNRLCEKRGEAPNYTAQACHFYEGPRFTPGERDEPVTEDGI